MLLIYVSILHGLAGLGKDARAGPADGDASHLELWLARRRNESI
jgi:hypothetical protein